MSWTEAQVREQRQPRRKTALAALSEAQVTRQIVEFLRAESWFVVRLQSGLFQRPGSGSRIRIGSPGMSDWLALRAVSLGNYAGMVQAIFLEMKSATGELSPLQLQWMAIQRKHGFLCEWFQSFDQFKQFYQRTFGGRP